MLIRPPFLKVLALQAVAVLVVWFAIGLVLTPAEAKEISNARSFPPYPDRWELAVPQSEKPISNLRARMLPNGDVLFSYQACCGKNPWRTLTFFEGRRYASVEEAFKGEYPPPINTWQYELGSRQTIRTFGTGRQSRGCYDGLEAYVSVHEGPINSTAIRSPVLQKTVLYFLDEPQDYESQPHCNESRTFRAWAESLGGSLVPLRDKTFLLVDREHSVAIRMDERLQTRSSMLGDRLFVVDTSEFRRRFGGSYGDRADGGMDLKKLHEDLRDWLNQLRKENKQ